MRIPHPTYGGVTATVALFAALGGTSYAALSISGADIRNGTVTSADVRDGSLRGRDAANGSITGGDLKNGSLGSADIGDGSLQASDFAPGQLPAGPAGPAGPQGPQGPPALTNAVARIESVTVPNADAGRTVAECAPGEIAVGGGAGYTGAAADNVAILVDSPLAADGDPPEAGEPAAQWEAIMRNNSSTSRELEVYVLCAKP